MTPSAPPAELLEVQTSECVVRLEREVSLGVMGPAPGATVPTPPTCPKPATLLSLTGTGDSFCREFRNMLGSLEILENTGN